MTTLKSYQMRFVAWAMFLGGLSGETLRMTELIDRRSIGCVLRRDCRLVDTPPHVLCESADPLVGSEGCETVGSNPPLPLPGETDFPSGSVRFRWFPLVSVRFRPLPSASVGFRWFPLVSVRFRGTGVWPKTE